MRQPVPLRDSTRPRRKRPMPEVTPLTKAAHVGANASTALRASWRFDVSETIPLAGRFEIAVDIVVPAGGLAAKPPSATPILCCLPGGFLSKRYFDLRSDSSDGTGEAELRLGLVQSLPASAVGLSLAVRIGNGSGVSEVSEPITLPIY